MKMPNRVLQFAQAQTAKAWRRFQLLPLRMSLDPNSPPYYFIEAQGERGDGLVVTVRVAIDKVPYDLLHGQQALNVALGMANKAIQQLQTYTGCSCKEGAPCEQHQQVVN